jgi:hypothetical protein
MRGSTEEGSTIFFFKPPYNRYENTEFSADFKNAKRTYKVIPNIHGKLGLSPKMTGIFGIPFYMCVLHRCILHFLNWQKILRFLIPIMGVNNFFTPLMCSHAFSPLNADVCSRSKNIFVCFSSKWNYRWVSGILIPILTHPNMQYTSGTFLTRGLQHLVFDFQSRGDI